jgi:hypothetical protein
MDAKSKFREAVRSCNEAADAVVKSDDRSKREVLEQIRALYYRLAKLLVKCMQRWSSLKTGPLKRKARRLFDRSDVTYPLLAITLAARRDNFRDTLAVFEQRLATIKAPPVEPVAA